MITHKSIGYSGRLGNQMFQYAALKAVSLETGFECYLPNHTKIKHDGCFDFTNNKWIEYKLDLLEGFEISTPLLDIQTDSLYQEKEFEFNSEIFSINDNTAIDGYFQSYKYFDKYRDIILNEFSFKKEILDKCSNIISNYSNPISIHVRRGDYVNHPGFWITTPEYLQEALNYFNDQEHTFLIFSDDIEWCEQIFPNGVIFIKDNTQFEDMCLMSLCEHNITSNSTFSWWAAYLNKNKNKKTIVPSKWYTDSRSLNDLYFENWIKI